MIDSTQKNNPRAVQLTLGTFKTDSKKHIADVIKSAKFNVSIIVLSFLPSVLFSMTYSVTKRRASVYIYFL